MDRRASHERRVERRRERWAIRRRERNGSLKWKNRARLQCEALVMEDQYQKEGVEQRELLEPIGFPDRQSDS